MTISHKERIRDELRNVGISSVGLLRFTSRYLPYVIHADEHIFAAVNGRRKEDKGMIGLSEGMLVATDRRVIYIDHKPGYTTMDEIAYDVISGINVSAIGLFESITLFTKVANYTITYARHVPLMIFAEFIEKRRLDIRQEDILPVVESARGF